MTKLTLVFWKDKQNWQTFSWTKNEREKTQINKIRNEREDITTNPTEIKKIIRNEYEQLYVRIFDNVEEMNKFVETYDLPRLIQEEIESLNRPITKKEIELVI